MKYRREVKTRFEAQNVLWLTNQKSLRRRHYAATHYWQGDPFHKDVHATDEVVKCVPRAPPAGPLSNQGFKNWKKEIHFQICENNIRNFIFGRLKKIKSSVGKKVQKDLSSKKCATPKTECWDFIEEFTRLLIIELLSWDWEEPNYNIFSDCYNTTLSNYTIKNLG